MEMLRKMEEKNGKKKQQRGDATLAWFGRVGFWPYFESNCC